MEQEQEKLTEKEIAESIYKILNDNGYKLEVKFVQETVLGNSALFYNFVVIPDKK